MEHADRADRLHSQTRPEEDRPGGDRRDPFQRDKDRILYRAEFRRLGGIAQVVTADEPRVFHNRLSHSLKVGQLGRRLAEYLLDEQGDEDQNLERLDPLVVEAAGLAHDIGHPPFAHVGREDA